MKIMLRKYKNISEKQWILEDIDLHEYSRDFLQILMKCRDIDREKHRDQIHLFSFYQCLFFNILYYFSILDFETARISNIKNIQKSMKNYIHI